MAEKPEQVWFHRMIPDEIVARRNACPVAYLPVGSLEWHGAHLPFGVDGLTVTYIAERAAREVGGVAFPTLYHGVDRHCPHMDSRPEWRKQYMEYMELPQRLAAAFPGDGRPLQQRDTAAPRGARPEGLTIPFSVEDQRDFQTIMIAYAMLEITLYGFPIIVLLPGHGPNRFICADAERVYARSIAHRPDLQPPAVTRTIFYVHYGPEVEPLLGKHWLHADKWEGSVAMAAAPDTVHLDRLPEDPAVIPPAFLGDPYLHPDTGYNEEYRDIWPHFDALDPRRGTDEEYGRRQVDHIVRRIGQEVEQLLSEHQDRLRSYAADGSG